MFTIWLITSNKKSNSTKRLSYSKDGVDYDCKLVSGTSIINPVLELVLANKQAVPHGNHAYIPQFNRYYFVNDIKYSEGFWYVSCTVDVLASFRTSILNSTQFVTRSTIGYDDRAVETLYPAETYGYVDDFDGQTTYSDYAESTLTLDSNRGGYPIYTKAWGTNMSWSQIYTYFTDSYQSGIFVVSILSPDCLGNEYYMFTPTDLKNFIDNLMTYQPSDMTDVSTGVSKMLFNGLQYITSIKWYPHGASLQNPTRADTINIGGYSVPTYKGTITPAVYKLDYLIQEYYFDLDVPKHPKTADSSANFLTLSPYSQYNLYYAPFGNIPLDTTKLLPGLIGIRVYWKIDYTTGASVLKIYNNAGTVGTLKLIYTSTSTLGVQIPVSNLVINDLTAMAVIAGYTAVKQARNSVTNNGIFDVSPETQEKYPIDYKMNRWAQDLVDKFNNWISPVTNKTQEIADFSVDALASSLGQIQTNGKPDSMLSYYELPVLYAWFADIRDADFERFGRPTNKRYQLSDISGGFCKCADANVDRAFDEEYPTLIEQNKIVQLLNSGVYLE